MSVYCVNENNAVGILTAGHVTYKIMQPMASVIFVNENEKNRKNLHVNN